MTEGDVEKTVISRLDRVCGVFCVAFLLAFVVAFIVVFNFAPPLTWPPSVDEIAVRVVVPLVVWTLIIGVPLGIIFKIFVEPRLMAEEQSSALEETE